MADENTAPLDLDGALSACRDVLCRSLESEVRLEALREPLRTLSRCARRENVPPERVLIEVKQLLHDTVAYETMPPQVRDSLRGRLVEMAIAAYFADDPRA